MALKKKQIGTQTLFYIFHIQSLGQLKQRWINCKAGGVIKK